MSEAINHLAAEVDVEDRARARTATSAVAFCRRLAGMGHDLKTPLNAIMGYTELLLDEFEEVGAAGKAADLRKVLRSSSELLGMIEQLVHDAREAQQ